MMEVEKKSKVCFLTTQDRGIFPMNVPPTRFGNDLAPIRGAPNRGPGCYENEDMTNFWHQIETFNPSNKGYTMGARTGPRFLRDTKDKTPAPTEYQTHHTEPRVFSPSYKPFHSAAERFPVYRRDVEEITPGAGTYEHDIKANRKVEWHRSFGGTPINLPSVKQYSTIPSNTEKLMSTKDEKKYHRKLAYLKLYYD